MKDIVILGSSGFAKEVLWLLEANNEVHSEWNILGFVDGHTVGQEVLGLPVLGDDAWLMDYPHPIHAACGFGSPALRHRVVETYRASGPHVTFPNLIAHSAQISRHTPMGQGNIICANTVVAPAGAIGNFVILNLGCSIGHDTVIGDFTTVNPGVGISGNVVIGEGCDIGTGTHIIQGLHIGPHTVTGAGSAIIRDVPGHCTVVGVPGRILEK